MEEIRIRQRERSGGGSLSYGIAFLLIAFGVLKVLESVMDDDFEGAGQIIIGCALFMQTLSATVIANALPAMAVSFGVNPVHLNTAITVYLLTSAIFLPLTTRLYRRA